MKKIPTEYYLLSNYDKMRYLTEEVNALKKRYKSNEEYFNSLSETVFEILTIGAKEYHEALAVLNVLVADNDEIHQSLLLIKDLMDDIKQQLSN